MNVLELSQCPTCGGHKLTLQGNSAVCEFCGNIYYDTKGNSEFYSMLDMALANRQIAKFDEAFEIYNLIVNKFYEYDLTDAYYGMFLCEYSIIFESDISGKAFPCFYDMRKTTCQSNYYYKKAMEHAQKHDENKMNVLMSLTEKIEYARKTYIEIEKTNKPYDIFICYKKTDNNNELTDDFHKAKHIYSYLKNMGFKVFFADETINKQAVREWEPNIYYALYTAKAMIVMCSSNEYLNSPWVQNEWKRFISIKTNNINRAPIIPIVCNGFKANELPNMLAKYQALEFDNKIEENIKDALLSLTTKVNNEKEFLFTYKKPVSKKLIATLTSIFTAIVLIVGSIVCYYNIPRLTYEKLYTNTYSITGKFGKHINLILPDTYKGADVTEIADSAFENDTNIVSVTMGNNLTKIGKRAFAGMSNLKEVVMGDNITQIGNYAFYDCNKLVTINISNGLTTIPTGMFSHCESLDSITFSTNITRIDVGAFKNCNELCIINYAGSKSEYGTIDIRSQNGNLSEAYVIYNYTDSGNENIIFIAPTINYTIGKGFSDTTLQYNSTLKQWEVHKAIDLLTASNEPVYAIADGTVNSISYNLTNGTYFSITHTNGFVSFYHSVSDVQVIEGQEVKRGQIIAKTSTSSGEASEGNHLHFQLMLKGVFVNPNDYINM